MLIGSDSKNFSYKTPTRASGKIDYNLELYTDGQEKQHSLNFEFEKDKTCPMIPTFGSVLLKTGKEEVIELQALFAYDDYEGKKMGTAHFPISEEELNKIINDGIIKIRIQIIAGDDNQATFAEKEWNKDEIGVNCKAMLASIEKKWDKLKAKYLESQKSFDSAF